MATASSTGSATWATIGSSRADPPGGGDVAHHRRPGRAPYRAVAEAIEGQFAGDLSEHLADIARHWAELAPYGEAAIARTWALRAADDAVRRLAYEEAVRLYRAALALPAMPLADEERCRMLVALAGPPTWPATFTVAWMPQLQRRTPRPRPRARSS